MLRREELRAGISYMDITPPIGTELGGYGFYPGRKAESVRRQLYAKALVLEQGDARIALIVADLFAVSREIAARARALVETMTGIPAENVIVACSHTFSGPATLYQRGHGD